MSFKHQVHVTSHPVVSHLDQFVPAAGDDNRVTAVWGETDTGDPLTVTFILRNDTETRKHDT